MAKLKTLIKKSGLIQLSWLNPIVLGILPALIIIYIKPITFNKYNQQYLFDRPHSDNELITAYLDLENDLKKEKIKFGNDISGKGFLYAYDENDNLLGQYNLNNELIRFREKTKCFTTLDINNDSISDIFVFTQHMDSLFLNIFDYAKLRFIKTRIFITKYGGYRNANDVNIFYLSPYDRNNDKIKELYFSISTGFGLYPRQIFSYNFVNNQVIKSINTGANGLRGFMLNKNNQTRYFIRGYASGNCPSDYPFPYHDSTNWFMIFNENLKLVANPISLGNYPSTINSTVIDDSLILIINSSQNIYNDNAFYLFNLNGELIHSNQFQNKRLNFIKKFTFKNKNYIIIRQDNLEYFSLNPYNFTYKKYRFLKRLKDKYLIKQKDIQNDGSLESFFYNFKSKSLIIFDNNLKIISDIPLAKNDAGITAVYTKSVKDKMQIIIIGQKNIYEYALIKNKNYWLRIPFFIFIYSLSILFVGVIMFLQKRRIEMNAKIEKQITNLQLQNFRNQLDPHFTFNALNSVGNAIYKQNKEEAYDLFQRFTRMIRSSLLVSDQVFRSLDEELQFTRDYLEFQKTRFKDKFDFTFNIGKDINLQNIKIPKMLIQGFTENAVKHAFYNISYKGLIAIQLYTRDSYLYIEICDNGIGIKQSKKSKATSGTQKGEMILIEQLRQINKLYKKDYKIAIVDKSDEINQMSGTKILIQQSIN